VPPIAVRNLRPSKLVFSLGVTEFGIPATAPTTRGKIIGKPSASPTVFETGSGLGTSAMITLEFAYGSVISRTALSCSHTFPAQHGSEGVVVVVVVVVVAASITGAFPLPIISKLAEFISSMTRPLSSIDRPAMTAFERRMMRQEISRS